MGLNTDACLCGPVTVWHFLWESPEGDAVYHASVYDAALWERVQADEEHPSRRAVLGMGRHVEETLREAVHWQIRFMRLRGTPEQSLQTRPTRESFGGYTVERRGDGADGGRMTVDGIEVCPMTLSVLRTGGVMRAWV